MAEDDDEMFMTRSLNITPRNVVETSCHKHFVVVFCHQQAPPLTTSIYAKDNRTAFNCTQ